MGRPRQNLEHSFMLKVTKEQKRMMETLRQDGVNISQFLRNKIESAYKKITEDGQA